MSKKEITVYWSPLPFYKEIPQWNMLYREPESVLSNLRLVRNKPNPTSFWACPVFVDTMRNVYQIKSNFDLEYTLPIDDIIKRQNQEAQFNLNIGSVSFTSHRKPSIENHINLSLNICWLMFADSPVEVKLTAPYFPAIIPGDGVMLTPGQFDIGSWYGPLNLDYHIPITTTELKFKKDKPLVYLEFLTDKKIVFKRYNSNQYLKELSYECSFFHQRIGRNIPLLEKYKAFKNSRMREIILTEIKNNLID